MLPILTNVQEINTICPLSAVSASSESANFDLQFVDSMHAEPVYTEVLLYYIILYKRESANFCIHDGWGKKEVPELPSNY